MIRTLLVTLLILLAIPHTHWTVTLVLVVLAIENAVNAHVIIRVLNLSSKLSNIILQSITNEKKKPETKDVE